MQKKDYIGQYILIALLACKILHEIIYTVQFPFSYESYEISDWLINYEGGFVRRGLIGQMLLGAYQIIPFDVKTVIIAFDLLWFGLFAGLMVNVFRRQRWSLLPFVFALALTNGGIPRVRRDYLIMLAVYVVYYLYIRYQSNRQQGLLWASVVLASVFILIYEPVFFLTIPVLCLMYFCSLEQEHLFARLAKTVGVFALPVITMALVCLLKGQAEQAQVIWQSWYDVFVRYPQTGGLPGIGEGVGFLGHGAKETVLEHLDMMYCINSWWKPVAVLAAALLLFCYPLFYIMVTRVPGIDHKQHTLFSNSNTVDLSNVFLIQLVGMSPMLAGLSCDMMRNFPYILYTSYMLVYLAQAQHTTIHVPKWLNRCSETVQSRLGQMRILHGFWGYAVIYMLFVVALFAWQSAKNGFLIYHV